MAKKSIFDYNKWERKHVAHLAQRAKAVKKIFDDLALRAALFGVDIDLPSEAEFHFSDYPALDKRVDKLIREVAQKVTHEIEDAEEKAWLIANAKNDALVDLIVKGSGLPEEVVAQWKQPNLNALKAFQARKIAGMTLSHRVWHLTKNVKQELELALELGIGEGKSAAQLSRDVRQYLNEPNKLFRRVRDKHGILRLSKAAKMYHPGRGVYRSSYKNALRLTATETNMAYRSADHERWSQIDWITGVRIQLSNNHTLNGLPFHDLCDELEGVYPKDFVFTGWHPFCRCYATSELANRKERTEYLRKMANGEDVSNYYFSNQKKELPKVFGTWLEKNAERIQRAETLPYFLRDNGKFLTHNKEGLMIVASQVKTPLEIAAERHAMRTPEQAKAIQDKWDEKIAKDNLVKKTASNVLGVAKEYPEVDVAKLQQFIDTRNLRAMKEEARNVAKQVSAVKKDEKFLEQLIPDVHEWKKQFTSEELHVVYDAVEKKLAQFKSLSLDEQVKKLDFEIQYVANPSIYKPGAKPYPTWKVSQDAFVKQQAKVIDQIEWNNISDVWKSAWKFNTKSKEYIELVDQLRDAILLKDKKKAQNIIAQIELKKSKLLKEAAYRAKKKGTSNVVFDTNAYSQERKDKAIWCKSTKESRDKWSKLSDDIWNSASKNEQEGLYAYTAGSGHMNRPLRGSQGSWSNFKGVGKVPLNYENGEAHIRDLFSLIERTQSTEDIWLQRGVGTWEGVEGFFDVKGLTKEQVKGMVGKEFVDWSFMSCGSAKGTGFSGTIFNIYCPKGTKMIYVDPHSAFKGENETILQLGTKFRITKVEVPAHGNIYIDMEVIGYEKHPLL